MTDSSVLLILLCCSSVICEDCVTFDFERDFNSSFSTKMGVCGNIQNQWNVGLYEDLPIDSPDEGSSKFVYPNVNLSCASSFTFEMIASGVLEINMFMRPTSPTDQVTILAHQIVPDGQDVVAGTAWTIASDPNFVGGWITVRIRLSGTGIFDGYITLLGMAASDSIVLIDSFRYISPNIEKEKCIIYEKLTTTTTQTDKSTTEIETTQYSSPHITTITPEITTATDYSPTYPGTATDMEDTKTTNTDSTIPSIETTYSVTITPPVSISTTEKSTTDSEITDQTSTTYFETSSTATTTITNADYTTSTYPDTITTPSLPSTPGSTKQTQTPTYSTDTDQYLTTQAEVSTQTTVTNSETPKTDSTTKSSETTDPNYTQDNTKTTNDMSKTTTIQPDLPSSGPDQSTAYPDVTTGVTQITVYPETTTVSHGESISTAEDINSTTTEQPYSSSTTEVTSETKTTTKTPPSNPRYGFWNAYTITMVVLLILIVLIVTSVVWYYIGKRSNPRESQIILPYFEEPPKTLTIPRVSKVWTDSSTINRLSSIIKLE